MLINYSSIESVLNDVRQANPIIIVDDSSRENEGDVFVAAQLIHEKHLDFLRKEARGNICVPLTYERAESLGLRLQHPDHYRDENVCRTLCEVDFIGIKDHGVSYRDKVLTIRALSNPLFTSELFRPGHIRPLRAEQEGLSRRRGHTEAAIEMAELAGLYPAGVICEILGNSGMARGEELESFAQKYILPVVTIADIIEYKSRY